LKFGLRAFRKNAWFTTVALVSITIGIGVNTAIFSGANSVLLHPLPYRDADRLVISSYIPAHRAARIDPVISLRTE
jgi:ABC-type lipoprotein release transport system permease subunit